jgi:hypothetical protein
MLPFHFFGVGIMWQPAGLQTFWIDKQATAHCQAPNKDGNMYSLEYIKIPKVFLVPYTV